MRKVVEIVGLPGAGKSTVMAALTGRVSSVVPLDKALHAAASSWISRDILGLPWLKYVVPRQVSVGLSAARTLRGFREFYRDCPALVDVMCLRLRSAMSAQEVGNRRLLETNLAFMNLAARWRLLETYGSQEEKPVLIDEDWVQFVAFTLNWGDESSWDAWLSEAFDVMPLPQVVIWLRGAAGLSEERQVARGKVAAIFNDQGDITAQSVRYEARFERLALERLRASGVKVVALDACLPTREIVRQIEFALS